MGSEDIAIAFHNILAFFYFPFYEASFLRMVLATHLISNG